MFKKILIITSLFSFGCSIDTPKTEGSIKKMRIASFLPENNYHKITYLQAGEVTKEDFDVILQAVDEIYSPIVSRFGGNLVVKGDYNSKTVNAYADRQGKNWSVSFFGGLAKHPQMKFEGFALVACHELGHHLAGAVLYPDSPWDASVEGMSDYFSTASCARKLFDPSSPLYAYSEERIWKRRNPQPDDDTNQSDICTSLDANPTVCKMSLDGGLSLGRVLASLGGEKLPTYDAMDRSKIKKTQYSHPKAACRLAAYYGGTVCNKEWNDSVIPRSLDEAKSFICTQYLSCWLNENNL